MASQHLQDGSHPEQIPALSVPVCPFLGYSKTVKMHRAPRTANFCVSFASRQRESDSRSAVEDANAKFYRAFKDRDLKVGGQLAGHPSSSSSTDLQSCKHSREVCLDFCWISMQAMSEIWGSGEHVQCIHPAAGCIAGRDNVSMYYYLWGTTAVTLCCKISV